MTIAFTILPQPMKPPESRICGRSLGAVYFAEGKTETAMEHKAGLPEKVPGGAGARGERREGKNA